jgi:hypothetical protein
LTRRRAGLATQLGEVVYRQRDGEAGLDTEVDRIIEEMRVLAAEIRLLADD